MWVIQRSNGIIGLVPCAWWTLCNNQSWAARLHIRSLYTTTDTLTNTHSSATSAEAHTHNNDGRSLVPTMPAFVPCTHTSTPCDHYYCCATRCNSAAAVACCRCNNAPCAGAGMDMIRRNMMFCWYYQQQTAKSYEVQESFCACTGSTLLYFFCGCARDVREKIIFLFL